MENDKDIEARRAEAVEELRVAFAELESGEGLTRFVGGHGFQSRVFEFEWREASLQISFRLPFGRILQDEASQKEDDEEIGAAIRMAMLLLATAGRMDASSRLEVSCNDRGTSYDMYLQVQNELTAAIKEMRDELSVARFGKKFADVTEAQRTAIEQAIPVAISEAEPTKIGG